MQSHLESAFYCHLFLPLSHKNNPLFLPLGTQIHKPVISDLGALSTTAHAFVCISAALNPQSTPNNTAWTWSST